MLESVKKEAFKAINMTENNLDIEKYRIFDELLQEQLMLVKSEAIAEAGTIILHIITKNTPFNDDTKTLEFVKGCCLAFIRENPEKALETNKQLEKINRGVINE